MPQDINATDLEQETISTLDGSEQFVMFDTVKGKRAALTAIAEYTTGDKTQLSTTDKSSIVGAINEVDGIAEANAAELPNKANVDGAYEGMTVGNAEQIVSSQRLTDKAPYLFRTSGGGLEIGDREYVKLVGASAVVNQIATLTNRTWTDHGLSLKIEDNVITYSGTVDSSAPAYIGLNQNSFGSSFITGHKYYIHIDESHTTGRWVFFVTNNPYIEVPASNAPNTRDIIFVPTGTPAYTYCRLDTNGRNGETISGTARLVVIDLTAYFGASAIPNRAYTLEQGTAGSGIAWLKSYGFFTKPYYPYNAGTLQSTETSKHVTNGFNQWDEEWELGYYNSQGEPAPSTTQIRAKNYIPVIPNNVYYFKNGGTDVFARIVYYDADKNISSVVSNTISNGTTFTIPSDAYFMRFNMASEYGATYNHDICINLHWDGERDGEYEPYVAHEYDMPDTELRGLYKLDANNNIYADGDTQSAAGETSRRYGIVDLGTRNWINYKTGGFKTENTDAKDGSPTYPPNCICSKWYAPQTINTTLTNGMMTITGGGEIYIVDDNFTTDAAAFKTAMDGVYLIYELATPTTESSDPFQSPQIVDNWGTEEFVDGRTVELPVGHETEYPANLKDKLEAAPNSPSVDGLYLMKRENGDNTYTQYVDPVPARPSTDGTYVLKATVSGGTATLSWVAE